MKFIRETALVKGRGANSSESRKTVMTSHRAYQRDIFRQVVLTPHEEMEKVLNAKDCNIYFESAINTATDFIMGPGLVFKSEDEYAQSFIEQWSINVGMEEVLRNAVSDTISTGNGYMEQDFMPLDKSKGLLIPEKFYPIPDSSTFYVNSDEYGNPLTKTVITATGEKLVRPDYENYYIQRIPNTVRHPKAQYWKLSYYGSNKYIGGGLYQVYGIPVDKRKIIHFQLNYGKSGMYGRSPLASAINDHEMLYEIERSIAVLAKYKAVPRKIWSIGDKDLPATGDEIDDFIFYLENLDKEDDAWINKPISATDMSYSGKEMNLDYAINHIKKKMIAGVSLDFLSGMGQDVNRATATQELLAFILSIYSKRKLFLRILQKEIIDKVVAYHGLKQVTIEFADLEFETKQEKETRIRQNWQTNMITYDEMREAMGYPKSENRDIGNKLFTELQAKFQVDSFSAFGEGIPGDSVNSIPPPDEKKKQLEAPTMADNGFLEAVKKEKMPKGYNIEENLIIETPDINDKEKQIDFQTFLDKFMFMLEPGRRTEMYYKRNENGYEISFNQNGVLLRCNVSYSDIVKWYAGDKIQSQDVDAAVKAFEIQFLNNAIEEV